MIANLQNPIAAIRGALGLGSEYYARMLNGQCVIQHKPRKQSQKQKDLRAIFGDNYGTSKKGKPKLSTSEGAPLVLRD